MKLKGFTPDQYILYNLKKNNIDDYISEKERWYSRRINKQYTVVLDDKLIFYEVFSKYLNIPENIFFVRNKKFIDLKGNELSFKVVKDIIELNKEIFVKPIIGGGGKGVFKIGVKSNNFYLNGNKISEVELSELLLSRDNHVANPAVEQSTFSKSFYPDSVNTIRLVTTYDYNISKSIATNALHRFGTSKTGVVDNASSGGLFSEIDISTGIMSEARNYLNEKFPRHPDTNCEIEGVKIPKWDEIVSECLEVAQLFPFIPYMAWDIVLTNEGISVIEINASTDLLLIQIFRGMRNSQLGYFLESQGCLKAK